MKKIIVLIVVMLVLSACSNETAPLIPTAEQIPLPPVLLSPDKQKTHFEDAVGSRSMDARILSDGEITTGRWDRLKYWGTILRPLNPEAFPLIAERDLDEKYTIKGIYVHVGRIPNPESAKLSVSLENPEGFWVKVASVRPDDQGWMFVPIYAMDEIINPANGFRYLRTFDADKIKVEFASEKTFFDISEIQMWGTSSQCPREGDGGGGSCPPSDGVGVVP